MSTESLIWTLLPDGFDLETGELRSTIFVSPRLRTGGTREPLKAFPTFHHWPAALDRLKFLAEVDGVGTVDLERDDRNGTPDLATWDLLFGGDVFVDETEVRDLGTRRVHSFPAAMVADELLSVYGRVAAQHATEHPSIHDPLIAGLASDLGRIGDFPDEEEARLDGLFHADDRGPRGRRGRFVPHRLVENDRSLVFALANRFYDRRRQGERLRDARGPIKPGDVPPRPERKELDFHNYVAAFGDYRYLLRMLGLAIDVRMPSDAAFVGTHRYRVVVGGGPEPWMNDDTATPWMNYECDDRWFVPRTRDDGRHDIRDGQLLLESKDYFRIHQIDIDGSALKATNTASTVSRQLRVATSQAETMASTTSSLPALRGAGLTVTRQGTAETVVGQFDHTLAHAEGERNGKRADLWADDVIRGYRWEAEKDGTGEFRSLVARVGTYTYHPSGGGAPQPVAVPAEDEGFVKGSSTTSVPGDEDLYLHEAIASWSGWSMVTSRPGGGVTENDQLDGGQTPLERDPDALDAGLPLETSFRARPGSLPTLRFGHEYRLRARTVDLAANSVEADRLDDQHASPPTRFQRWEPVPAPVLVARRAFGEGESQLRMVIRSTAGVAVDDYLALARVAALAPSTVTGLGYLASDERWVVPPKTSQQLAELHGVFDDAIGSGDPARIQAAYEVAAREAGQLPELVPEASLVTPYLPDVLSRGVRFNRFLAEAGIRRQDWPTTGNGWWDRQPFRVVLVDGAGPAPVTPTGAYATPVWDAAEGTLTVPVAQADTRTVRISSAVEETDLELMGMYERLLWATGVDDWQDRRHEALESRNWMLTPWVELTIVHAVEKPLADPVIGVTAAGMARGSGETFCALVGSIATHARSTGRLDIDATWTEQVDDVTKDLPVDGVDGREPPPAVHGHVGDFLLEATEDACRVGRDDLKAGGGTGPTHRLRHEFGDTRHRTVTYEAMATTRFREYFPPAVTEGVDETGASLITRTGGTVTLPVPSSRRPDPPDIAYVIPTFRWTTELVGGGGRLATGLARRRVRHCGLRVYLRRPWYSSGDDERLGVVLEDQPWLTWPIDVRWGLDVDVADRLRAEEFATRVVEAGALPVVGPQRATALEKLLRGGGLTARQLSAGGEDGEDGGADALQFALSDLMGRVGSVVLNPTFIGPFKLGPDPEQLLTRVGADPVFASRSATTGPYISQFPLRTGVRGGLSLAETPRAKVTVVAHTPRFDPDRRLWYCDIELDAGAAYQPFVRLALCRYQANSIDEHHISKVVLADFAQLLPRRVATVRPRARGLSVSLSGPVGVGQLGGTTVTVSSVRATRLVTATVERLADGGDPDLEWVQDADPVELEVSIGEAGLGDVTWSGQVPTPTERPGFTHRLLIREFEIHPTDDGDELDPFDSVREAGFIFFQSTVRHRLVYADSFAV